MPQNGIESEAQPGLSRSGEAVAPGTKNVADPSGLVQTPIGDVENPTAQTAGAEAAGLSESGPEPAVTSLSDRTIPLTITSAPATRRTTKLSLPPLQSQGELIPASESQVAEWVKKIHKNPRSFLGPLRQATPKFDPESMAGNFALMYEQSGDWKATDFLQRLFRRPDAPADAPRFPLRVEVFYLIVSMFLVAIVTVMLLLGR